MTILAALAYDINFFPEPAFSNNLVSDADYINYRVFVSHDIHHIVRGFSLDGFGELGVISISAGQFNHPGVEEGPWSWATHPQISAALAA